MEQTLWDTIWARPDLLGWSAFGSFSLYLGNRLNNHQPFSLFKAINVDVSAKAKPLILLTDMIVSSVIGALLVFAFVNPETGRQAIAAGLGLTGILSSAAKGA